MFTKWFVYVLMVSDLHNKNTCMSIKVQSQTEKSGKLKKSKQNLVNLCHWHFMNFEKTEENPSPTRGGTRGVQNYIAIKLIAINCN